MTLSVGEAIAVNTVARYLGVRSPYDEDAEPTEHEVLAALEILASGANRKLMAGLRPKDLEQAGRLAR
jgi:hypothetical protein